MARRALRKVVLALATGEGQEQEEPGKLAGQGHGELSLRDPENRKGEQQTQTQARQNDDLE